MTETPEGRLVQDTQNYSSVYSSAFVLANRHDSWSHTHALVVFGSGLVVEEHQSNTEKQSA